MSITKKNIEAIEALLPFLFSISGSGEAAAKDAAESLMELLDTTSAIDSSMPPVGAGYPMADVLMFQPRGGL
jgi:hypothetical protein